MVRKTKEKDIIEVLNQSNYFFKVRQIIHEVGCSASTVRKYLNNNEKVEVMKSGRFKIYSLKKDRQ